MIKEPTELRDRLMALAAVAPLQARSQLVEEVAIVVAKAAHQSLLQADGATIDVEVVCANYRRELWLWLVGERTWEQCVSGLTGRLSRRLAAAKVLASPEPT